MTGTGTERPWHREPLVEEPDPVDDEPVETTPVSETSPSRGSRRAGSAGRNCRSGRSAGSHGQAPEETSVRSAGCGRSGSHGIAPRRDSADGSGGGRCGIAGRAPGNDRRGRHRQGPPPLARRRAASRRKRRPPRRPAAEAKSDARKRTSRPSLKHHRCRRSRPSRNSMDSAEHRTTERETQDRPGSRRRLAVLPKPQKPTPPEPQHKPEPLPEPEPEPAAEETVVEEPESLEPPEPPPDTDSVAEQADFAAPPPPRRREVRMRGNVEDDLAADLAAAEIGGRPARRVRARRFAEETGDDGVRRRGSRDRIPAGRFLEEPRPSAATNRPPRRPARSAVTRDRR